MMKINIISGFLGAGKTTLIRKLLTGSIRGEKVVLLENEYGDVSVDGSFMKDSGITVTELSNGCICCSLVGDLHAAIDELIAKYQPDRLLVEPSGVGKLSEIVAAVEKAGERHEGLEISGCATVVDAKKCKMHIKAFGEFYLDQIKTADTVIFSRTQLMTAQQVEAARALIEENHPGVRIITTPWDDLSADAMMEVIESGKPILSQEEMEHHHHDHDGHCTCGCHDHDHEHEHEHHHHHHGHDADEVFVSIGAETARRYEQTEIQAMLDQLSQEEKYGHVLRAKGVLQAPGGEWFQFDYVPGESQFRPGTADYTGRLCIIGAHIHEAALRELFKL